MGKANIKLPDGTTICIEGSADEIAKVLNVYNANQSKTPPPKTKSYKQSPKAASKREVEAIDIAAMANFITGSDDAESYEDKVLNETDMINRILMCLYVNKKQFSSQRGMTTGEVSKLLKQLGVPISTANVSSTITRKANSFVMADGVRKKGAIIHYELNRRGIQKFEEVLK